MQLTHVCAVLTRRVDDSGDGSKGDDAVAGTTRGEVSSKLEPAGTCHARRQSSPDVTVPLNLTLKHGSVKTSALRLASSPVTQRPQHDAIAYSPSSSRRPVVAGPLSPASTHADEVHDVTMIKKQITE